MISKIINEIYNKNLKLKAFLAIAFVLVYIVLILLSGGSFFEILKYILAAGFLILIPGSSVFKLLNLEKYFTELKLSLSFTLGIFILVFCFYIDINFSLNYAMILPLILISLKETYSFIKNKRYKDIKLDNQNIFSSFFIAFLILVIGFGAVLKNAHPELVGQNFLSQDLLWHTGNAKSFLLGFPARDLRVDGVLFYYHFLNELFSAAISYFTGIDAYNIMAFYNQSFITFILVNTLYSLGIIFYNKDKLKSNIFTVSIFLFTCISLHNVLLDGASEFSVSLISALLTNVNATALAFIFLGVFVAVFYRISQLEYKVSFWAYLVLILNFILLTFSKSPIAAILIIALIASLLARFIQFNFKYKEIILAAVLGVVFLFFYETFFSYGAEVSGTFNYVSTLSQGYFGKFIPGNFSLDAFKLTHFILILGLMGLEAICISPFLVLIFIYSSVKNGLRLLKLDFFTLSCYAVSIGGFIAFFFTSHQAFSQVYFLYTALFFIHFIAIKEFDFKRKSKIHTVLYTVLGISFITTICLYINFAGSGFRQLLYHYDIIEKYDYNIIIKSEDELAAKFLNEHLKEDELFLTNRISDYSPELSSVYTAFSGRQAYLEGYKYTVSNMGAAEGFPDVYLMHENVDKIFNSDTDIEFIKEFCEQNNIKFILYSQQSTGEKTHLNELEVVFKEGTVTIYKLEF